MCDNRRGVAETTARAWGVAKAYDDHQRLLTDPEIDLVELLVPQLPAVESGWEENDRCVMS